MTIVCEYLTVPSNELYVILKKIQETKSMPFVIFRRGSFAVHIGDHLRLGIICGPIWGSFPVWGSFAALYSTVPLTAFRFQQRHH